MQDTLHTVTFHFVGIIPQGSPILTKQSLKLRGNKLNDKLLEKSEQYFIYVMIETFSAFLILFCESIERVRGAFTVSEGIRGSYLR